MKRRGEIVRFFVLLGLLLAGGRLCAQTNLQPAPPPAKGQIDLAIGYSANPNNQTDGRRILLQGGSVELSGQLPYGFAGVASVTGLHTGTTITGVPQNLVIAVFGPRFTFAPSGRRHKARTSAFLQALAGEADGFDGIFPYSNTVTMSANSLALKIGGGIDVALRPHISARIAQIDYLQTQLPNATNNMQRSVLLGAGIVWHMGAR